MFYRSIIFTEAPLMKAYRYRDKFQLVPIFYMPTAPISIYASHIPCILEYQVEDIEEKLPTESMLREKGLSEETLKLGRKIPNQARRRKEILHLLSSFTNFYFFEYFGGKNCWGIQLPMEEVNQLSEEEKNRLNSQTSHWTIRGYLYPNIAEELKITGFTACKEYYEQKDEPIAYFTVNPNMDSNQEIKISPYLEFIIDSYFSLCDEEKELVRQCIGLLYEGIELFNTNRSVSLLSIVSSIEGMANLDLKIYGNGERLGPTDRFLRYLKTYVAGRSEQKFRGFYKRRCDITHEGRLFLSDLDLYGDIQKQDEDWRLRLEILQAARLAMYNWMRRRQQDG